MNYIRNKGLIFSGCHYCKLMRAASKFFAYGTQAGTTLDLCCKHVKTLCNVRRPVRDETYVITNPIF